jgi:ribonuclease P protein component
VLPAAARVRRSEDFRAVMRGGTRAGKRRLVVHALKSDDPPAPGQGARAGFVVSKAVGNSVVRHRVIRRLRHLVADRLGTMPAGCSLVVRALPPAATATSMELGTDLDAALRRLGMLPGHRGGASRSPRATRAGNADGPDDNNGPAV